MNDLHYKVGPEIFLNKFQAASRAHITNQTIYYNMWDTAFDLVDWKTNPSLSWDELLDLRANQIAAKGRPIVLHFSGGTDSYTIYKVFERNNIHISAIYVRVRNENSAQIHYNGVLKFLQDGIYDPHCQIIIRRDEESALLKIYNNPEWIWNTGDRYTFSLWGGGAKDDEYLQELFGQDVVSVIGLDKPRLEFTADGKIYSCQDDINYARPMNCPGLDCFYISPDLPELHVKQSYLLKNYLVKKFNLTQTSNNFYQANEQYNANKFDWLEYSLASGRFGDLAYSQYQHQQNSRSSLIITNNLQDSIIDGTGKELFNSLRGTVVLDNYLKGCASVLADGAARHLGMNKNFNSVPMFKSKKYELSWN